MDIDYAAGIDKFIYNDVEIPLNSGSSFGKGINPDIMWAREEFEKAEMEGYPYKTLLLCLSDKPETSINKPSNSIIITSDGLYNGTNTHIWDDTNAKIAEYYPSEKLRYMIVFSTQSSVTIPTKDIVYFISNGTVNFTTYDYMWSTLKTFDLVGEGQVKVLSTSFAFTYAGGLERMPSFTMIPPTTSYTIKYENCYALMQLDIGYDTSEVTDFSRWLSNCRSLRENPYTNTENATSFLSMFQGCYSFVKYNTLNSSKVANFNSTFRSCVNLQEVDMGDTSSGTGFSSTFYECQDLRTVKNLNLINATSVSSIFGSCYKLKNLDIKNIKISLNINTGINVTDDSVIKIFQELHDLTGGTTQTLTLASPVLTKTDNIYVKLIDATDEMRAEDPYIDNKKPCVVCETTDEGSMSLKEYGISKNWNIA